ncbi:alpha/beta hydrolase [Natronomonas sp. EA1]|uniref:alpha/beta hydrolase n=1 Tax=Natronomonas sp. EA1 TaxID=3421655 RepID=UPI003EBE09D2
MRELDPQAEALLQFLADLGAPPSYTLSPASKRDRLETFFGGKEVEEVPRTDEFTIPGPAGELPVRLYGPQGEAPITVFYHGGGWTAGSLDTHDNVCRVIANRAECIVLSVDYRLAPEHPFPAAVNDAYAALEWADEHGAHVKGNGQLAVAGDSAGGNLAAAISLMARDRDGPDIDHQGLIYPAVASPRVHEFESYEENAEGYLLERASCEDYYACYVQDEVHARNAYLAPLLARDLSGLPDASVITAEFDPLRDEGRAYADRLADAGVDVTFEKFDGMIHGFVSMTDELDRAEDGLAVIADGLRESFGHL